MSEASKACQAGTTQDFTHLTRNVDTVDVERDGRPAYLQLAELLRRAIRDGTYPVGERLPSTRQLTDTHRVSLTTARRAVEELRRDGVIVGQQGAGIFVKAVPAAAKADPEERLTAVETALEALRGRVEALER